MNCKSILCDTKYDYSAIISSKNSVRKSKILYDLYVYNSLTRLSACALRPIAKAVEHLGEDIEVLTLPQTCSLARLSGSLGRDSGGIAETEMRGVERCLLGEEKSALGMRSEWRDWVCRGLE
jgi:hypothetical protein